ncbi:MAG: hypothetical protein HQM08_16395 [Candidatus Riflebacteria bacterium]|nr:hypothetical protein [Candidatus Riflebacteria bacterium]
MQNLRGTRKNRRRKVISHENLCNALQNDMVSAEKNSQFIEPHSEITFIRRFFNEQALLFPFSD